MFIYAFLDLASTKSSYSPNWRVQNLFGEYDIEVTRQFGEYEFFLMSNPASTLRERRHEIDVVKYSLKERRCEKDVGEIRCEIDVMRKTLWERCCEKDVVRKTL